MFLILQKRERGMCVIRPGIFEALEIDRWIHALSRFAQTHAGREEMQRFLTETSVEEAEQRRRLAKEILHYETAWGKTVPPETKDLEKAWEKIIRGEQGTVIFFARFHDFLNAVGNFRKVLEQGGEPEPGGIREKLIEKIQALRPIEEKLQGKITSAGEILDSASARLRKARETLKRERIHLQGFLQQYLSKIKRGKADTAGWITQRNRRFVVALRREWVKEKAGFVHDVSASQESVFFEPQEVFEGNHRFVSALEEEEEALGEVLREWTAFFRGYAAEITAVFKTLGLWEALAALGRYALKRNAHWPVVADGDVLELHGARHPLLVEQTGEDFENTVVPLEVKITAEKPILIISGPNAGGKTVALKTIGMALAAQRLGLPFPAREDSKIPLFSTLDTDLDARQDIERKVSSFAAKLEAAVKMLEKAKPGAWFFLDELASGTDPVEGSALALAVLQALREKKAFVVATTHQPLLKYQTHDCEGFQSASMRYHEEKDIPTYQLECGAPGTSRAFALARRMGFPKEILDQAEAQMPRLEYGLEETLKKWKETQRKLEERLAAIEERERWLIQKEEETRAEVRKRLQETEMIRAETIQRAHALIREIQGKIDRWIQQGEKRQAPSFSEITERFRDLEKPILQPAEFEKTPKWMKGQRVFWKKGKKHGLVEFFDEPAKRLALKLEGGMRWMVPVEEVEDEHAPSRLEVQVSWEEQPSLPVQIDVRGLKAEEALQCVMKHLDAARAAGLPFVRILHGKGEGILRRAIHHCLKQEPDVHFEDAPPEAGGSGVTLVRWKKDDSHALS